MRVVLAVLVIALGASCTRRGTYTSIPVVDPASTTQPAGVEPGEAESHGQSNSVELPKAWSHPSTEVRGVWMTSKEMLMPRTPLLAKLDALRAAHFNVVLIDTYFRGCVAYPGSAVLPQFPGFHG